MTQSFAHDGGIEPRSDESPAGSLDEQLAAEIADHLAASASDLRQRGEAENDVARLALIRFGDVARVKRQCWWIHNGEQVMFRTAGIVLLSLLTVGVGVVAFGGWQLQRSLASRTEELSERLASLTATQQAMLAQQRPPEITGHAYLGDPSVPAKDVEIQVFRFSEEPASNRDITASGVVARRLRTDALGRFDSGTLQSGEYCVLGPLMDPKGEAKEHEFLFKQLQSAPLYLTAGAAKSTVELNLAASGRLRLAVAGIPNSIIIAGEDVQVFVQIQAQTDAVSHSGRMPLPPSDEPPRDGWPLPLPPKFSDLDAIAPWFMGGPVQWGIVERNFTELFMRRPADLPGAWLLPPRNYSVTLQLEFCITTTDDSKFPPIQTKLAAIDLKLTPGGTPVLTLSVLGDSLEKRFEDAVKELERNPTESKIVPGSDLVPILEKVAAGIELNVAVASE